MSGDSGVCLSGDSFNSIAPFADNNTTMRVSEWDRVINDMWL